MNSRILLSTGGMNMKALTILNLILTTMFTEDAACVRESGLIETQLKLMQRPF